MNKKELVNVIEKHKRLYRDGNAEISDTEYDKLIKQLEQLDPDNPLLHKVEEEEFQKPTVKHPKPMLSIEKAFSVDELKKWFNRIEKKYGKLKYRVSPKLDGLAARYSNGVLCTRGDGYIGYDITDAFDKGLVVFSNLQDGDIGEVVMDKRYFEQNLSNEFVHPRNVVVGAVKCDDLSEIQKESFNSGSIHFVPYRSLVGYHDYSDNILRNIDNIVEDLSKNVFPIDGYVIEVEDEKIKEELGHTSHHYKWNVAYKLQTEVVETEVRGITWQTGRGGNITPVLEVDPVKVSGAVVSRVTAHNYGYLKEKGIDVGSKIEIIRSGEVIPKVIRNLSDPKKPEFIYECPSCGEYTVLVNDIIKCTNFECPAQVSGRLRHFFKTLKVDLFGSKTIDNLVVHNFWDLNRIFSLSQYDYQQMGFGPKQGENLRKQIKYLKQKEVEDWRLLTAMSIPLIGKSESKKLMEHYELEELINISMEEFSELDGFGLKKANSLVYGLEMNNNLLMFLMDSLNVLTTKEKSVMNSEIQGKNFVFTGTMSSKRDDLFELCESLGATPQKSITKSTDYLVMGEKVGKSKIDKAEKFGIMKITEDEFLEMTGE